MRLPISVVVPVRNAEAKLDQCLRSIVENHPLEIIVVDGLSTDRSSAIAAKYTEQIISDGGQGIAAARQLGAERARGEFVAYVDTDVMLPPATLAGLLQEMTQGRYDAIQARLVNMSTDTYWGRAIVQHHRWGRSKYRVGTAATLFKRDVVLAERFDPLFTSGEDLDMCFRLGRGRFRMTVSENTVAYHWFEGSYAFVKAQFLADGHGIGLFSLRHAPRSLGTLLWPLLTALHGSGMSLIHRRFQFIAYFALYLILNYLGVAKGFMSFMRRRSPNAGLRHREEGQRVK